MVVSPTEAALTLLMKNDIGEIIEINLFRFSNKEVWVVALVRIKRTSGPNY